MNVDPKEKNLAYKYQFPLLTEQLWFSGWFDSINIKEKLKNKY